MTLTKPEKKWLKNVQTLLSKCPSKRIGFYTVGDHSIGVYDTTKDDEIYAIMDNSRSDFGPTVDEVGAGLGGLTFPSPVHSTAG